MEKEPSGWAIGYTLFATCLLAMVGLVHVFQGIVALFQHDVYVVGQKWAFQLNTTAWGWIHLLIGLALIGVAYLLTRGNVFGRTIAVILAIVSVLADFLWLPYYPVWGVVSIALGIAVIWALTVHGRDIVR